MALIKAGHQLEQASFAFDGAGEVTDVTITVNFVVKDDVTGEEETRVRKTVSRWAQLTAAQRSSANSIGKRLLELAQGV